MGSVCGPSDRWKVTNLCWGCLSRPLKPKGILDSETQRPWQPKPRRRGDDGTVGRLGPSKRDEKAWVRKLFTSLLKSTHCPGPPGYAREMSPRARRPGANRRRIQKRNPNRKEQSRIKERRLTMTHSTRFIDLRIWTRRAARTQRGQRNHSILARIVNRVRDGRLRALTSRNRQSQREPKRNRNLTAHQPQQEESNPPRKRWREAALSTDHPVLMVG